MALSVHVLSDVRCGTGFVPVKSNVTTNKITRSTTRAITQGDVEAALEALSTVIDVSVSCDTGLLCNGTVTSTCALEFLTEMGDVPLVSATASNIDSLAITEYQVTPNITMYS